MQHGPDPRLAECADRLDRDYAGYAPLIARALAAGDDDLEVRRFWQGVLAVLVARAQPDGRARPPGRTGRPAGQLLRS